MLQKENQEYRLKSLSLRAVLLLMLMVAAGASATAYSIASTLSASSMSNGVGQMVQNTSNSPTIHPCNQTQAPLAFTGG